MSSHLLRHILSKSIAKRSHTETLSVPEAQDTLLGTLGDTLEIDAAFLRTMRGLAPCLMEAQTL